MLQGLYGNSSVAMLHQSVLLQLVQISMHACNPWHFAQGHLPGFHRLNIHRCVHSISSILVYSSHQCQLDSMPCHYFASWRILSAKVRVNILPVSGVPCMGTISVCPRQRSSPLWLTTPQRLCSMSSSGQEAERLGSLVWVPERVRGSSV